MSDIIKSKKATESERVSPASTLETLKSHREFTRKEIFRDLVKVRAEAGTYNRGQLPNPQFLRDDLTHLAGVAEVAAHVLFEAEIKAAEKSETED